MTEAEKGLSKRVPGPQLCLARGAGVKFKVLFLSLQRRMVLSAHAVVFRSAFGGQERVLRREGKGEGLRALLVEGEAFGSTVRLVCSIGLSSLHIHRYIG